MRTSIFRQPISASAGLSGSLQQVSPGLSYLVAAGAISITTMSNGQIVLSGSGGTSSTGSSGPITPLTKVLYVDISSSAGSPNGSISAPYTSPQNALNATPSGSLMLLVTPGDYSASPLTISKTRNLMIRGLGDAKNQNVVFGSVKIPITGSTTTTLQNIRCTDIYDSSTLSSSIQLIDVACNNFTGSIINGGIGGTTLHAMSLSPLIGTPQPSYTPALIEGGMVFNNLINLTKCFFNNVIVQGILNPGWEGDQLSVFANTQFNQKPNFSGAEFRDCVFLGGFEAHGNNCAEVFRDCAFAGGADNSLTVDSDHRVEMHDCVWWANFTNSNISGFQTLKMYNCNFGQQYSGFTVSPANQGTLYMDEATEKSMFSQYSDNPVFGGVVTFTTGWSSLDDFQRVAQLPDANTAVNFVNAQRYVLQQISAARTLTIQLSGSTPGQLLTIDSYNIKPFSYTIKFGPNTITTISSSGTPPTNFSPQFKRVILQTTMDGSSIKLFGQADPDAQYLTLGNTGSLSNERQFVPGTGLSGSDGGANASYILAVDNTVVATLSGSVFSGPVSASAGLSGTLQRVNPNLTYLAGGGGITITTQSSGQVLISGTFTQFITQSIFLTQVSGNGAGDQNATYLTLTNTASLSAERVLALGTGLSGTDGGANGSFTIKVNPFDLTGSLQSVSAGLPYLVPSGSLTIVTQSNGQVLLSTPQFAQNFFYTGALPSTPFHNGTATLLSALALSASNLASGTYRLGWSYTWRANTTTLAQSFKGELFIGTTSSWQHFELPTNTAPSQIHSAGGFMYLTITGSTQNFDLRVALAAAATNITASMYARNIELWRVL